MTCRGLSAAIVFALVSVPATRALALWNDQVTPFVEEKITHDDNVFRTPKNADPQLAIPPPMADTYHTTSAGLNLDVPVSRQRFQLGYARNFVRYDQLTQLDLDGYDARALWLWQIGNDASGQLSYSENLALASFANIIGITPDPLKTRQAQFNGAYSVTPRWRAQAGANGFQQRNDDPQRQVNDIDIVSGDASLSYTTPASTAIGLGVRAEDGRYPSRDLSLGFDNAYRQYGVDIVADWTPSGVSHLSARVGRISRRNEHLPERDFYGTAARVQYDWKPTGKFSMTALALQDISPYDDIRASYVFVKGLSLRPVLKVSEKLEVSANLDYSLRDYLGDPTSGPGGNRTDRVRSAAAALAYRPVRVLALQIGVQRETRSSTTPLNNYEVNVYSAAARLAF